MKNAIAGSPSRYVEATDRKQPGAKFDDYEIDEALRSINKANKIKKNKPLMRAVQKRASEQLDAVTKGK